MNNKQYVNRYSTRYSSKKRGKNTPPTGLIAAVILVIVIAVVVIIAVNAPHNPASAKTEATKTAAPKTTVTAPATSELTADPTADPTTEPTKTSDPVIKPTDVVTDEPTSDPTAPKTAEKTEDPAPIPPTYVSDDLTALNKWAVENGILPLSDTIDRGYLADLGKAADGSPANSWYFGKLASVDENGVPTFAWDRYKSTLDLFEKYGAIYRKDTTKKITYLTFDCGYEYGKTGRILDTLKEKGVKAVFFCSGEFVSDPNNKELLLRMVNEGHLIGNHTDIHPHDISKSLTDIEFVNQLVTVQNKVDELLGYHYNIEFYRPPEGAVNERDLCLAKRLGYTTVLWSFAYGDYNVNAQPDVAESLANAEAKLYNGCVYLLHAVSETNTVMLGDLIDYMRAQGYQINRLDQ